ncbi:hypothetical protein [Streptomyces graminilatus]|uniref:hypothetical protein n=1 Tax=Streptomyces graminilatus TaxID=1464070 RepID=UPI000D14C549
MDIGIGIGIGNGNGRRDDRVPVAARTAPTGNPTPYRRPGKPTALRHPRVPLTASGRTVPRLPSFHYLFAEEHLRPSADLVGRRLMLTGPAARTAMSVTDTAVGHRAAPRAAGRSGRV